MSTKASITLAEGVHLYQECGDEKNIYLSFDKCSFEAQFTNDSAQITVSIPLHVWEFLRTLPVTNYDLAQASDEDLRALVTNEVDQRIAMCKAAGPSRAAGIALYGDPDTPREEQIHRGMAELARRRTLQQEILAKTKELLDKHRAEDGV